MNAISNINLNGIISKLKDHAEQFRGTDLEKKVKEATSNANWGVTFQIKEDIARATYDYQSYNQVMNIIWKRMGESGKNWKMVFKSLDLLEYLLKRGSERVISEAQGRQYQIRTLRDFHFSENDGRDKGGGIREKSRSICDLLNDKATLDAERSKARSQVGKYMGISHYDSFGSSFNAHRTSAQYDPDYSFREQGKTDADNAVNSSTKKKKKKKKKVPKPENDLSDDVLSDSDNEDQRSSIKSYQIPEPPADKSKTKRKKKKEKAKSHVDEAKIGESAVIPDFFSAAFAGSSAQQPSQNVASSDPVRAFDFTVATSPTAPTNAQPFDAFFGVVTPSAQQSFAASPKDAVDPFQSILQTPPPKATSNTMFQQPPSFTPAPLFSQPQHQQSMFSPSAFPDESSGLAAPASANFAAFPQASESDNDDWGFVSAPNPQPGGQPNFFGTPAKQTDTRNDAIWDDFSTLSLSSPSNLQQPQLHHHQHQQHQYYQQQQQQQRQQQHQQQQTGPASESVFAGFDFLSPAPPANKQNDLASFF